MEQRIRRLIQEGIKKLELDLSGLTVLTEVGSNFFVYTPIIAALSGASKVLAWTKDTRFGTGESIVERCKEIIEKFNIDKKSIVFRINERPKSDIAQADIVTNLGMVRPISADFIETMNPGSVISYMCESWEIREGDVDINFAIKSGIKVGGTWENHPDLKIFDGCGTLCVKIVMEAGFEVYQNNIAIISDDHFGEVAERAFINLGASKVVIFKPDNTYRITEQVWDFVLIADYKTTNCYLGENGLLNDVRIPIVHLSGKVDLEFSKTNNYMIYPKEDGYSKRMTRTLADLGPKPIIDLHAAGLKVGESLVRNNPCAFSQIMIN